MTGPFHKLIATTAVLAIALASLFSFPVRQRAVAPVSGAAPSILGVHGRMTDEVEQWKVDRTVEMVKDMGAGWLVEYFPWAYMEPSKGRYDWSHADMVVAAAASQGLRIIARVDMVPDWARPPDTSSRYLGEDRFADYAAFLGAFAERYGKTVRDIIVWNEPNLNFEWGYRAVDPASYARLLEASFQSIKAVDPGISVVAAGLAPTLDSGEWGLNDLTYLRRMYEAGARRSFDKLAVHAYGWRSPPEDAAADDRVNFARAELQREIMVENGDGGKKVLITESGWNDHPRWAKAVRPSQRVEYTLRALDKVSSEWPWVEAICFWSFRLPRDSRNYNDYFTLVSVDFTPKPIYLALQRHASLMDRRGAAAAGPRG